MSDIFLYYGYGYVFEKRTYKTSAKKENSMNEEIRKHLTEYNKKEEWGTEDKDLVDTLRECGKTVFEEMLDSSRWWDVWFVVKDVNGMLIGYEEGRATGDDDAEDIGYGFQMDTICRVEPKEKVVTVYERVK